MRYTHIIIISCVLLTVGWRGHVDANRRGLLSGSVSWKPTGATAWWPGTSFDDAQGVYNVTADTNVTISAGAWAFNVSQSSVTASSAIHAGWTNGFTFVTWVKTPAFPATQTIMATLARGGADDRRGTFLRFSNTGVISLATYRLTIYGGAWTVPANVNISTGQWTYVATSYNGAKPLTNGAIRIWVGTDISEPVDATLNATATDNGAWAGFGVINPLTFGYRASEIPPDIQLTGNMRQAVIYPFAITSTNDHVEIWKGTRP
jgi:hypothetical protein